MTGPSMGLKRANQTEGLYTGLGRYERSVPRPHRTASAGSSNPMPTEPSLLAAARASEPLVILYADDDEDRRAPGVRALSNRGHRVIVASTGRAALEDVATEAVDGVVLAHDLPDLAALDILRGIEERRPRLPVLLIVPLGFEDLEIAALRAGAVQTMLLTPRFHEFIPGLLEHEAHLERTLERAEQAGAADKKLRDRALLQLRESEQRFRLAASQAPILMWATDADLRITWETGAMLESMDVDPAQFRGRSVGDLFPEEGDVSPISGHRLALTGRSVHFEYEWRDRWFDVRLEPMRDEDGKIRGVVGIASDLTERRRAEAALRLSEERFNLLGRATNDMAWDWDLETDSIWRNENLETVFGYTAEDMEPAGAWWELQIHPEDRERVVKGLHETIARGDRYWSAEYRWKKKDGTFATILDRGFVLHDDAGRPVRMVGSTMDITGRRREEQIREAIFRISEAAVTAKDLPALYAEVHRIVSRLMPAENFYIALHDPETDLLSFPYFVDQEETAPAPYKAGRGLTEYVLRSGKPFYASTEGYERLVSLGEVVRIGPTSLDWVGVPLVANGRTIGVLVVQTYERGVRYGERERDVLSYVSEQIAMAIERKRTEEALRSSEALYRTLFEAAADAILLVNAKGIVLDANPATEAVARMGPELLVGTALDTFLLPEDVDRAHAYLRDIFRERPTREPFEITVLLPSGLRRSLSVRSRLVSATASEPCAEMIVRDVTEQEEMQRRLLASERLASVGQMAAYIAHEINTPLANIALLTAASKRRTTDEEIRARLERIDVQRRHAASIIADLLSFTRHREIQPVEVDLRTVLTAAVDQMEPYRSGQVELVLDVGEAAAMARVDPLQMQEVLVNLLRNALEATSKGSVTVHLESRPGYRILTITDTGPGIPPEIEDRLFQPFVTTKRQKGGTGLGLALCQDIVRAHGGEIHFSSKPGKGTTFTIVLPQEDA